MTIWEFHLNQHRHYYIYIYNKFENATSYHGK